MRNKKIKWSQVPLILGAILIIASSNAQADDYDAGQASPAAQQQLKHQAPAFDQQYRLPTSYQGKYYPNDEPAIGYHGTSNTSQNDTTSNGKNGSYYYYYY